MSSRTERARHWTRQLGMAALLDVAARRPIVAHFAGPLVPPGPLRGIEIVGTEQQVAQAAAVFQGAAQVLAGVEQGEGDERKGGEGDADPVGEVVGEGRAGPGCRQGRPPEPEGEGEEQEEQAPGADAALARGDLLTARRRAPAADLPGAVGGDGDQGEDRGRIAGGASWGVRPPRGRRTGRPAGSRRWRRRDRRGGGRRRCLRSTRRRRLWRPGGRCPG